MLYINIYIFHNFYIFFFINLNNSIKLCIPFFLKAGFPFLTETKTMSPNDALGNLLKCPLIAYVEIRYKALAPELSAQLITAPTGRPTVTFNLVPT